jgi:hypothetical protein
MIKEILSTIIAFSLILAPVSAQANDPQPASELELVTSINEGESAPFSGTLFSTAAAAKLLAELELNNEGCQLAIDREVSIVSARYQLDIDNLNARIESLDSVYTQRIEIKDNHIDFLDEQLIRSSRPKNELWFAIGVVSGVILTGAAAWSMGQISHTH